MPLNGEGLKTEILAELNAQFPTNGALLSGEQALINGAKDKMAGAMAPTVVDHITANAVVEVTGVTPGLGTSGPGTVT